MTATQEFLPLDLQAGAGWSVALSGLPLVLGAAAWVGASFVMARLAISAPRQVVLGAGVIAAGCLTMALPLAGGVAVALGYVLTGAGFGIENQAVQITLADHASGAE